MRKTIIVLICCLYTATAGARIIERITLDDGSVLSGTICRQHPGKDFVFLSERSEICIPAAAVQSQETRNIRLESLPETWKTWAGDHPFAVLKKGDERYLSLCDLQIELPDSTDGPIRLRQSGDTLFPDETAASTDRNTHFRQVRILEKGERIRYLDFEKAYYLLNASAIRTIEKMPRTALELSGLVDAIETRDGRMLEGQITVQYPGKAVHLIAADGVTEVIPAEKIAIQKRKKLNRDQPLFEQSPTLDIIVSNEGKRRSGIIVEQHYGSDEIASHIVLEDRQGNLHREEIASIRTIDKEPNPDYRPLLDVEPEPDEWLVNRQKARNAVIEELKGTMIVMNESPVIVLSASEIGGKLTLEFKDRQSPDANNFMVVKPSLLKYRREALLSFTYEDIVKARLPIATSVSPNATVKCVFDIPEPGDYILYNPKESVSILCRIE